MIAVRLLTNIFIIIFIFAFSSKRLQGQLQRENGKWGYKKESSFIIRPVYDTIYPFDSTGKICLACCRTKSASANKFMKVLVTTYSCHYYNQAGKSLLIRNHLNDTFGVFSLSKNSLRQYNNLSPYFTVTTKGKKYLLTKDFRQQTFKDYAEIRASEEPGFYVAQILNEAENMVTGVIDRREEQIVPYAYTDIRFNSLDSLIIACSANTLPNAMDDVFDYKGKKVQQSRRHLEMATKNFLIQKVYEPKECYILVNTENNKEVSLVADEMQYYKGNEVLIRVKRDWYIYDLQTNQKKLKTKT
jgi:hypothetical protein